MRIGLITALIVLLMGAVPVGGGIIDTVCFERDRLVIDAAGRHIHYDAFESISDAGMPSVPVTGKLYYSHDDAADVEVVAAVLDADTIDPGFRISPRPPDEITSDIEYYVSQPVILKTVNGRYPAHPFLVSHRVIDDVSIWSVHLFPVQCLDDGRIVFNRRIEIRFEDGGQVVQISPGVPKEISRVHRDNAYAKPLSAPTIAGCPIGNEYIVVTSPELAESFDRFLALKRQTGFDAAVAITDSIFAQYDGLDEAEALRNYLKDFHAASGRYVLLGGDHRHVPVRYTYFYNTDTPQELEYLMICDLYFADLNGDWDSDGDGIWGEPTSDRPDLGAEVTVGRLPFSQAEQVEAYTAKLRDYLFDPGLGDRDYLDRSVFIVSDQMRDYFEGGQQYEVAVHFPADFAVDCERMAESPTGDDPAPTGPYPADAIFGLNEGYGFVNVLAHGRPDGFVLRSCEYNLFPKNYLLTDPEDGINGAFDDLDANNKMAFYYSVACTQAATDLEALYGMTVPSAVEKLLSLDSAGAIGMVAFSRWGWVGSSYKLMAAFYEHLFGDAGGYPAEAMYRTYLDYPYYLDQIYGQNYYGDPSLNAYCGIPDEIRLTAPTYYDPAEPFYCRATINNTPLTGYPVTVKIDSDNCTLLTTDADGYIHINLPDETTDIVEITCFMPGAVSARAVIYPNIAADADDEDIPLPLTFAVNQNYPNPFNPGTTIGFTLTRTQEVTLEIYDILGRPVNRPVEGRLDAGEHTATWNGFDFSGDAVASGIYFYRLIAEEGVEVRKMMLLK